VWHDEYTPDLEFEQSQAGSDAHGIRQQEDLPVDLPAEGHWLLRWRGSDQYYLEQGDRWVSGH
jgi:hypothetical protein